MTWRETRLLDCSTPAACSAPARIRSTQLVVERGSGRSRRRTWSSSSSTARQGLVPGDLDDRRAGARARHADRSRSSTRPTCAARAKAPSSSTSSASTRCSRSPPSTAPASAICSTRSSRACRIARRPRRRRAAAKTPTSTAPPRRAAGGRRRDRRPSERGQVVARQPVAARRADDRQRDAGDDARCGGFAAALAPAQVPHRRHRGHPAAGARRRERAGRVGERAAGAPRDRDAPTSSCCVVDATAGATDQDAAIAGEADKAGTRRHHRREQVGPDEGPRARLRRRSSTRTLRRQLKFLDYAPDPAHLGADRRAHAEAARDDRPRRRVAAQAGPTRRAERFVAEITAAHPPASPGRRDVRILYAAQTSVAPPTFVFFTNVATSLHFSYERFLAEPAAGAVRLRRHAHPDPRPPTARADEEGIEARGDAARGAASCAILRRRPGPEEPMRADVAEPSLETPRRALLKAADVCEIVKVQPYVLRSWEKEFPDLGSRAAAGGPRFYRRADVERVQRIKQLVFGEGLTSRAHGAGSTRSAACRQEDELPFDDRRRRPSPADARARIDGVRHGLRALLSCSRPRTPSPRSGECAARRAATEEPRCRRRAAVQAPPATGRPSRSDDGPRSEQTSRSGCSAAW